MTRKGPSLVTVTPMKPRKHHPSRHGNPSRQCSAHLRDCAIVPSTLPAIWCRTHPRYPQTRPRQPSPPRHPKQRHHPNRLPSPLQDATLGRLHASARQHLRRSSLCDDPLGVSALTQHLRQHSHSLCDDPHVAASRHPCCKHTCHHRLPRRLPRSRSLHPRSLQTPKRLPRRPRSLCAGQLAVGQRPAHSHHHHHDDPAATSELSHRHCLLHHQLPDGQPETAAHLPPCRRLCLQHLCHHRSRQATRRHRLLRLPRLLLCAP